MEHLADDANGIPGSLGKVTTGGLEVATGEAIFEPFVKELPEYGFMVTSFWNRAAGQGVADPFWSVA